MRQPSDQAARDAALNPAKSFIVQAPAGSGKTGLLVRRYLTLLAYVESPEQILAITFTRKATAEMRQRITDALTSVASDEMLNTDGINAQEQHSDLKHIAALAMQNDMKHGWHLSRHPGRMRIQTIDSFCSELVSRMPWSSRFGSSPNILEDPSGLYQQAATLALGHVERSHKSPVSLSAGHILHLLDANFVLAQNLLVDMLGKRDKWLRMLGENSRDQLQEWRAVTIQETLSHCASLISNAIHEDLVQLLRTQANNLAPDFPSDDLEACLFLEEFPTTTSANIPIWRALAALLLTANGSGFRKTVDKRQGFPTDQPKEKQLLLALLKDLASDDALSSQLAKALAEVSSLPDPKYTDTQWQSLEALLTLLPIAVAELKILFREQGCADYIELGHRAEEALMEKTSDGTDLPTDLALAFDYQLKHILMDEFQDTSTGQIELLEKLLAGWQRNDGRTAFFVGDPMQSIYRFREAEVGNFINTQMHGIAELQPEPLNLTCNFRSSSPLVQWFNKTFSEVMPKKSNVLKSAVAYIPAQKWIEQKDGDGVIIHPLIDANMEDESHYISALIQSLQQENPDQSIAVLGRTRTSLNPIAVALEKAGIAYQGIKLRRLNERQAIQDLSNLVIALQQPADRLAWISVLRAPWAGMSLEDLTAICAAPASQPFLETWSDSEVLDQLSPQGQSALVKINAVLADSLQRRDHFPVWQNLQTTWFNLGGPVVVDPGEIEDCFRFFEVVRKLENQDINLSQKSLSDALNNLWAITNSTSSVQLSTIHGAKGLEFDIVILADLDRRPRSNDRELIRFKKLPDRLLIASRPSNDDADTAFYDYLGEIEKQHQHNETTRLLYVACTRAQRQLHLVGKANTATTEGLRSPSAQSLLALLWPEVEAKFLVSLNAPLKELPIVENLVKEGFAYPLTRIPSNWQQPHIPQTIKVGTGTDLPQKPALELVEEDIEFSWAGEITRICGIIIHQTFQHIDDRGWEDWCQWMQKPPVTAWENSLREHDIPTDNIPDAIRQIHTAVLQTIADPQAAWIFSNQHKGLQVEWPITGLVNNKIVKGIIDRSFVDNGTRWIIDFKSSRHDDEHSLPEFLQEESNRYRSTMSRYVRLVTLLDQRPVRAALYYPVLQQLVELPC